MLNPFNGDDLLATSELADGLQLNGNATLAGAALQLTPALSYQKGSAFWSTPLTLDADTVFQTQFQLQLTGGPGGADGFAFVLQNSAAAAEALGAGGGSLGYAGLENSLAIEFDTYRNNPWDPNDNHIAVLQNGDVATALATTLTALPDLNSGDPLTVWIDYDGSRSHLDVFLASTRTRPTTPALSYTVDLAAVLGAQAYVGFTGGTGKLANAQEITDWRFNASGASVNVTPGDGPLRVTEGGVTDTYSLVLNRQPTADVIITPSSDDGETTLSANPLIFTPSNWNVPQTVTVRAVDDRSAEGPHSGRITHSVSSADSRYAGLTLAPLAVAITDNDDPIPVAAGTGLLGEYFDRLDQTTPLFTRTDTTVDFDWGTGSPDPLIGVDRFSVRWSGQLEARYSEPYTLYVSADDGIRLWINNQLIIDGYIDQPVTEYQSTLDLVAGQKSDIRLEYYEKAGNAVAQLAWSSPTQAKQIIPQSQLYALSVIALKDNATRFVSEAAGAVTITAVRTGNTAERVTLEYTTNGVSGAGAAQADVDYATPSVNGRANTGQVVFEPGETEASFTIPILNDALIETNETFAVGIQNPGAGVLGAPRTVLVTLLDDDTPSTLAMSQPALTLSEGIVTATLTVQRSGNLAGVASIDFASRNGTARAGEDYGAVAGTLVFAAGAATQTITIPILNDAVVESSETFSISLSHPVDAMLGPQVTATITLLDDDALGGLTRQTVVAGLKQPTALDWTPNGRYLLVAQKNGAVRVVEQGGLRSTPLIDLSSQVNSTRDRGLLGIAIHPDFPVIPYVYLAYTYDPPETLGQTGLAGPDGNGNRASRLVRATVNPATMIADPASLVVLAGTNSIWAYTSRPDGNSTGDTSILPSGIVNGSTLPAPADPGQVDVGNQDNDPDRPGQQNQNIRDYLATDSESHTIGAVHFGPDGWLYVSNGDGASYNFTDPRAVRVQDVDNLSGKLLRLDPITGAGVASNPFFDGDPNSNRSKVFYFGLRNPFRFTFDPVTQLPVVGDVGWNTWEEINTGDPGANFGWPYLEGPEQNRDYRQLAQAKSFYANGNINLNSPGDQPAVSPLLALSHGAPDNAVAIMVGDFYDNDTLLFGDINNGTLYAAILDDNRRVSQVQVFDDKADFVVDMAVGPDGRLYGVDLVSGVILRW
jgi:glucose/arabinose dehydrogenase